MTYHCHQCRRPFDWSNGRRPPQASDCPHCQGQIPQAVIADGKTPARTELVLAATGGALAKFAAQVTGSQPEVGTADLKQLARLAAVPIEQRKRTFLEWLRSEDIVQKQLDQKGKYSAAAVKLAKDRTELLNSITEMFAAADRLSRAELEVEMDRARQQLEVLRIEAERLELEERIARQQALRDGRIRTSELEEQRKQHEIRIAILPPAIEPDPTTKAIADERRQLQAAARGREALARDCVRRARGIFRSTKLDTNEKAARIRAICETYGQDIEDLPAEIQALVLALEEDHA